MSESTLSLRISRTSWGWRGSLLVPTSAGDITLASEVPAGAISALRRALGPRGALDSPGETAGFLPVLSLVGKVYALARRHGPAVLRAVKRLGLKRLVRLVRTQGVPGLLRLVRGGLGGIAQTALRAAVSGESLPPRLAATLAGAYATTGALQVLPGVSPGVRSSAALAGRMLDASVAARMGDQRARAWLDRCHRDPRCLPAMALSQRLLGR